MILVTLWRYSQPHFRMDSYCHHYTLPCYLKHMKRISILCKKEIFTLQWRHNEHGSVSIHQRLHCLLNCRFRCISKKHQSTASVAFVWGIHRWPVNSPHNRHLTRKMLPFGDVIMQTPAYGAWVDVYPPDLTRVIHSCCAKSVLDSTTVLARDKSAWL